MTTFIACSLVLSLDEQLHFSPLSCDKSGLDDTDEECSDDSDCDTDACCHEGECTDADDIPELDAQCEPLDTCDNDNDCPGEQQCLDGYCDPD